VPTRTATRKARTSGEGIEAAVGDRVRHSHWGEGTVIRVIGRGEGAEAVVDAPRKVAVDAVFDSVSLGTTFKDELKKAEFCSCKLLFAWFQLSLKE